MINSKPTIMIADDDHGVRSLLEQLFTREGYTVVLAVDGLDAYEKIPLVNPDLLISDIQMPNMDGFALFKKVESHFPYIKRVLITGLDIDENIAIIQEHNIGNILPKGAEFNLNEVRNYINNLLSGDIFGLDKYFAPDTIKHQTICTQDNAQSASMAIIKDYGKSDSIYLEMALDELISNAIFHGVLHVTNTPREEWPVNYCLNGNEGVEISWACDHEKFGVSVTDPKGNLKKRDVLRWLNIKLGLAEDEQVHGKGFLLVRRLLDRLIINIRTNKKTECIIFKYFTSKSTAHNKPLLIHEI